MGKYISWEDRLLQFKKVHDSKYNYPAKNDPRSLTKIVIICPIHGHFTQTIKKHLVGQGCPKCSLIRRGKFRRLSQETFVERAKEIHKNFYSYAASIYTGRAQPITITCPIHGDFVTTPATHLGGHLCPDCALTKSKLTQSQIIADFKQKHGDKYDYSKVVYSGLNSNVTIICSVHGEFKQQAGNHRNGSGCPYCGGVKAYWKTFVANCNKVHNNKYTYPAQEFTTLAKEIKIICPIHGEFHQIASEHQYKYGCPQCGGTAKYNLKTILQKFNAVHGDRYDYSEVIYVSTKIKVKIICKKHGAFCQTPDCHLRGGGCPLCSSRVSQEEIDLCEYLKTKTSNILVNDRSIIGPFELDVVLPDLKIAIEYNGLYWHSSAQKENNYHKKKMELCNNAGYRLINIWQDDWLNKQALIKSFLSHLFGESRRIYARKTTFKEIPKTVCRNFLKINHIQGSVGISRAFGLYHNDELITATAFTRRHAGEYELTRHACKLGVSVIGALGKIVKNAAPLLAAANIYSFCDLSMYTGGSYIASGFKFAYTIPPDYKYIVETERKHKFNFRRYKLKSFLGNKFNPDLSEIVNMEANGYYRIFDCGKAKYVYNKK